MPLGEISGDFEAYAHEAIAVSTTAVALTAATYQPTTGDTRPCRKAVITVETNSIHWREDGVADPTAVLGQLAAAADKITLLDLNAVKLFRAIRVSADATIQVSYYR